MAAGKYRHRIEIEEKRHGEPDPVSGHSDYEYVPLFDVPIPAQVLEGPGREPFQAGTIQAETSARINIRYFDIDKARLMRCRILWDGGVLDIISAERDHTARKEWRLRCKEGASDG